MTTPWVRLRLSNDEKTPPLLYKFISTAYTYEIYMTDLTNVWAEQLSRQAILRRANDENTTIDPSEDAEQFGVLLQKIRDALHGEAGSSATLNHRSKGDSLELVTYTELPAPLEPLKWTLLLSKEPPSAATSQLLLPLVMAEAGWEARQQALIEQLHKKDWVLGKLFDKIETMGIDLGTIFPGTSGLRTGRKGTTLSQAARYIKGVAPFDEQAWFDEINKPSPHLGFAANIVKEFTGASSTGSFEGLDPPPDAWWEQVGTHDSPLTVPSTHKERDQDAKTKDLREDDATETDAGTETEDEFERQETPPRLKRSKEADKKPSDSTDEEGTDEDAKEPAKKPPPQSTHPAKATRSLGVIGGRKPPKPASPEPSPQRPTTNNKPSHPSSDTTHSDDETDSASDLDAQPSSRQLPKPKFPETKTHPKTGLGVIGGRKREPQKPSSPPTQKSPSKKTAQHSKLGVIGGRASRPAETRSSPAPQHHRTPSPSPPSPPKPKTKLKSPSLSPETNKPHAPPKAAPEPEPETEQEKADRKREELKRQLEMKSKAPAKKKRRF